MKDRNRNARSPRASRARPEPKPAFAYGPSILSELFKTWHAVEEIKKAQTGLFLRGLEFHEAAERERFRGLNLDIRNKLWRDSEPLDVSPSAWLETLEAFRRLHDSLIALSLGVPPAYLDEKPETNYARFLT